MKKYFKTILAAVLCGICAVSVTSCLGDSDDNSGMTPEQYAMYIKQLGGTYQGVKIFYINEASTSTNKLDSVSNGNVYINPADTTITLNFPLSLLAKEIKDKDLKEALDNYPEPLQMQPIKMKFLIYDASNSGISYVVGPRAITVSNVEFKGKRATVRFDFVNATPGVQYVSKGKTITETMVYLNSVQVNDENDKSILSETIYSNFKPDLSGYKIYGEKDMLPYM